MAQHGTYMLLSKMIGAPATRPWEAQRKILASEIIHKNRRAVFPVTQMFRPPAGRQHRGCITPQTLTHSLVLLKTGKITAQNMLI